MTSMLQISTGTTVDARRDGAAAVRVAREALLSCGLSDRARAATDINYELFTRR